MKITPDYASFAQHYMAGEAQVLSTQLVADLETPVSAFLKLADSRPWSCLLESVEGGAVRGRYSIIGLKPDLLWRCHGSKAEINRSEEHTSELQSLMRISYAVFCLKKNNNHRLLYKLIITRQDKILTY